MPKRLGPREVERLVSVHSANPGVPTHYTVDFAQLDWASVYAISLLYDWVLQITQSDHGSFVIRGHLSGREGTEYLNNIGFFKAVQLLDRDSTAMGAKDWKITPGQFSSFHSMDELVEFHNELGRPNGYRFLAVEDQNSPVLQSGDFRNVLLHELGDNAFFHGEGRNVRCCMAVSKSATLFDKTDSAAFQNSHTLEFIVSDNGPGIANVLKPFVEHSFCPDYLASVDGYEEVAKTILYAFEFDTTSDEKRRQQQFDDLQSVSEFDAKYIPTGLFYLRSLVDAYGGRVSVRTQDTLLTLDFANRVQPVVVRRALGRRPLPSVRGTHIFVQIPATERHIRLQKPVAADVAFPAIAVDRTRYVDLQSTISRANSAQAEFAAITERILEEVAKARSLNDAVLLISAAGLGIETKVFGRLLPWLLALPRHNVQIIIDRLSSSLMDAALSQNERLLAHAKERPDSLLETGATPLWLISYDQDQSLYYGATHQGAMAKALTIFDDAAKDRLHTVSNIVSLRAALARPPTKQTGYYFLIEGKYYTTEFYEVRRLLSSPDLAKAAENYLVDRLGDYQSTVVLSLSSPMDKLVAAAARQSAARPFVLLSERANLPTALAHVTPHIAGNALPSQAIVVVTDVVCTADTLQRVIKPFLATFAAEQIRVITFVDARESELGYVTFEQPDGATSVPVESLLRTRVKPIGDLPLTPDKEVLIVDPASRAPTRYHAPQQATLSQTETIELACQAESLIEGHIENNGTHFQYYLNLKRFLPTIQDRLFEFWEEQLEQVVKKARTPSKITLLYSADVEEWSTAAEEFAAKYSFNKVEELESDRINAPGAAEDVNHHHDTIWVLMPVMATARSLRRVLAFAANRRPNTVHISIAFSRVPHERMSFYQGITAYGPCTNVAIKIFSTLPLPTHSRSASCPICAFDRRLSVAARTCWDFPALRRCVEKLREPLSIMRASDVQASEAFPLTPNEQLAVSLRAYFESAYQHYDSRKAVGHLVKDADGQEAFLRMIGKAFLSWTFTEPKFKRALYHHKGQIEQRAEELLVGDQPLSLEILTGIHAFSEETLKQLFPRYLTQLFVRNDEVEIGQALGFALAFADDYGKTFAMFLHRETEPRLESQLLLEAARFPYWEGVDKVHETETISTLRWMLSRSTDWGDRLSQLRLALSHDQYDEHVPEIYDAFYNKGASKVVRLLESLDSNADSHVDSLWGVFKAELDESDHLINELIGTFLSLPCEIAEETDFDHLLPMLTSLEESGISLSLFMDNIFFNPVEVKLGGLDHLTASFPDLKIRVEINDDQPGILINRTLVDRLLFILMENLVHELGNREEQPPTDEESTVAVRFMGPGKATNRSTMTVSTGLQWTRPSKPEGGLRNLIDICDQVGAYYDFANAQSGELAIHFYADSKKLHYG